MRERIAGVICILSFVQFAMGRPPTASYEDDETFYVDAPRARKLKEKRVNFTYPDDGYFADPAQSFILHARRSGLEGRIAGGRKAKVGEVPYQLSLNKDRRHVCGATLAKIGNLQFAITAAHCICEKRSNVPYPWTQYSIRGGNTNKFAGQVVYIEKVVIHENYEGTYYDDIALLFLESQFKLDDNLQPVTLPDENTDDEEIETITVSGWGAQKESGQTVTYLQVVTLPVIDNDECMEMYRKHFPNTKITLADSICAAVPEGGKDACLGDSGGPAVAEDDRGPYLAGVVSWGKGCARPGIPGVYMKLSHYIDWIYTHVEAQKTVRRPIG